MQTDPPQGLSQTEAAARLQRDGLNILSADQHRSIFNMVWEVMHEPMFLLLLGAGAIYLIMGDPKEALVLLGFTVIIIAVTTLQERRTENALAALRDLSTPHALVMRDGQQVRINSQHIVQGDWLVLSEGERVPADGVVRQAHELAVDESMLTGESVAIAKFPETDSVFAGTMIVRGQGLMEVQATGTRTQLGRIGKSLQSITVESSPLRDEIGRMTRHFAVSGLILCAVLGLLYWLIRGSWLEGLLAGITLAMAVLPQEFPVIIIIFMALGARRIARHRVLTRRINAIETLGETTVLCVDKTGTLTQNRMEVAALWANETSLTLNSVQTNALPEAFHELLEYTILASEIEPHDPMEQAFHRFAQAHLSDTEHLHPDWTLTQEYELSPELLAMSHLWRNGTDTTALIASKGAPEAIADLCHLPEAQRLEVSAQAECFASQGLRVLGVAKASHPIAASWPTLQHDFDFQFVGLVGLADPLRPEVPAAIQECQHAGIRVVMITGDHPRTASAIATQAGLQNDAVLTGQALGDMTPAQRETAISRTQVFARVSPQQKLQIVETLKTQGEVVAMTGDGVNDAPALKAAHIGIAMGQRGTDVAREAASLILLDDNFTAIVTAIRLGRRIFANLRQAMIYTMAVHVPIIGLSILPLLLGMPLILAPIHIAFLELIIDPACSIVFEAETGAANLMSQPPRSAKEPLISLPQLMLSLAQGCLVTAVILLFYGWLMQQAIPTEQARALAFVTLVTANTALLFPSRSLQVGWRSMFGKLAPVTAWVLGLTLLGLGIVTLLPVFSSSFNFQVPQLRYWLLAFTLGALTLFFFEIGKRVLTRPATSSV